MRKQPIKAALDLDDVVGVDEAGRGPWAGPVVVAAVAWKAGMVVPGMDDSKALTQKRREALFPIIQAQANWSIVFVSAQAIDQSNILAATLEGMRQAAQAVWTPGKEVWIDGDKVPAQTAFPARSIVKGDAKVAAIAAASILAKVARDRHLMALDAEFPGYGFAQHKGYGTAAHAAALARLGPCREHRLSFKPVAKVAQAWAAR